VTPTRGSASWNHCGLRYNRLALRARHGPPRFGKSWIRHSLVPSVIIPGDVVIRHSNVDLAHFHSERFLQQIQF